MRRGIAALAVAALVCGCRQEDPPAPEEMMKLQAREGFEYRSAMRYHEDPRFAPVLTDPQDAEPVPEEPLPPEAPLR
jgi:hypothetical protein